MTKPHIAPKEIQPKSFDFSKANEKKVKEILAKYPEGRERSAIMPLLDLAQRQNDNWIPEAAMNKIAEIVGVAPIKVFEVATFYTMYNLAPVGKYHLQLCTTTPCWLRGSGDIKKVIEKKCGIQGSGVSKDGKFSLMEVECLGACVNAPMIQINDDYYEDLTPEIMENMMEQMAKGQLKAPVGSQQGRLCSMPKEGTTVLKDVAKKSKVKVAE